jgi:hypothetical protein
LRSTASSTTTAAASNLNSSVSSSPSPLSLQTVLWIPSLQEWCSDPAGCPANRSPKPESRQQCGTSETNKNVVSETYGNVETETVRYSSYRDQWQ